MVLRSLGGHSILGRILKRPSLLTRSKAFVRSMKATKSGCLCSLHFSWSCLREKIIYGGFVCMEAELRFRVDLLCRYLEPLQYYMCKDFPNNTEEGYAAIIIAVASVAFVFVQCNDVSIPHVSWYFAFTQIEAEDFMQLGDESLFAVLWWEYCLSLVPCLRQVSPGLRWVRLWLVLCQGIRGVFCDYSFSCI